MTTPKKGAPIITKSQLEKFIQEVNSKNLDKNTPINELVEIAEAADNCGFTFEELNNLGSMRIIDEYTMEWELKADIKKEMGLAVGTFKISRGKCSLI